MTIGRFVKLVRHLIKREHWDVSKNAFVLYLLMIAVIGIAAWAENTWQLALAILKESQLGFLIAGAFAAPAIEELVKLLTYRKLTIKSGLFLSFFFTVGEALLYWSNAVFFLNWSALVTRLIFSFHMVNYFTMWRLNFGLRAYLLATTFHIANNLLVYLYIMNSEPIFLLLYSCNLLILALVSAQWLINEKHIREIL